MTIQTPPPDTALDDIMLEMGRKARTASAALSQLSAEDRTRALNAMAQSVRADKEAILAANQTDLQAGREKSISDAFMDRLALDDARLEAIASGIDAVAALPDPVGRELARWRVPSGLDIARIATPLGVIGIIYESRPNVTADAGALCLRSGNAAILRCGSESTRSSGALAAAMRRALKDEGLPEDAIQLVPTTDRAAVGLMLAGLDGHLDVMVPRGGRGLVERVQKDARVPVIGHLEGLCHIYVDGAADLQKAIDITVNAKMRRTGICGAAETVLIDARAADTFLPAIAAALSDAGCELRGDQRARAIVPDINPACEDDWRTEYLAAIITIGIVDGLSGALAHIGTYSSGHTDAIITEDSKTAEHFLAHVDSSIVMHNASTQFADGGEFGMGAEIGIATGRIHARGPVGAEQLTIFKYVVRGSGQIRP